MTTPERDAAWREYAIRLGHLHVKGESLEVAEIDFKAGFDAGRAIAKRRDEPAVRASRASRLRNARG